MEIQNKKMSNLWIFEQKITSNMHNFVRASKPLKREGKKSYPIDSTL